MIVSFDFDDTLSLTDRLGNRNVAPHWPAINRLKEHHKCRDIIYIITSRYDTEENRKEVEGFIKEMELPIDDLYFTNGQFKGRTAADLKVERHYDDNKWELIVLATLGIDGIYAFDIE